MKNISVPMQAMAGFIARGKARSLPPAVVAKAKQHLLDSIAAMVSGAVLHPGRLAIAYAAQQGGRKEACVPGSRLVTSAVNAALAGGMCAHADETDDSHQPAFFHPGCAIVPAAWAMGERAHASGRDMLRAVVLGYDVGARVSLTLGAMAFHQRGHSSHTFGALFGASAAAGTLTNLNADQCRWLLSYTTQQASGVSCWMRDPEHVEKAFVLGGMTARNAVSAATMVEAGMTGVEDVFAGSPNLFSAYAPNASLAPLTDGLGQRHEIMRANIKKWSVGSPVQAALDSIDTLMREQRLKAQDVVKIEVKVRDDEAGIVDNRDAPNICMQHLIALMLVDGGLTFETSHDASRVKEARIRALRRRIHFEGSRELREAGGRQALVDVTTRTGHLHIHTRAVRGSADNPMTDREVDDKCAALLAPVLGARRARRLADAIWDIEKLADVVALRPLLRGSRASGAT
jgi:2-methylcitrate dehydratase PrpD